MAPSLRERALAALDAPKGRSMPQPDADAEPRAPTPRPKPATIPLRCERLPLLEVVYDRLVRRMSTSLRRLAGENVEDGGGSGHSNDFLARRCRVSRVNYSLRERVKVQGRSAL